MAVVLRICIYTRVPVLLTTGPLCSRPSLPNYDLTALKNLSYPMGTVVTLSCIKGYQLAGSDVVKCEEDGTWFPGLSNCNAVQNTAITGKPLIADPTSLHSKSWSGCAKTHCSQQAHQCHYTYISILIRTILHTTSRYTPAMGELS